MIDAVGLYRSGVGGENAKNIVPLVPDIFVPQSLAPFVEKNLYVVELAAWEAVQSWFSSSLCARRA